MKAINKLTLIQQLEKQEGFRPHAYKCTAGKLTVGIGRNIDIDGGKGLTHDEALYLLENDIDECHKHLINNLPWYNNLDEIRQTVLINMCFNMGIVSLLDFKKTLDFIAKKKYDMAANEMLQSRWARQVGKRAQDLADQMRDGHFHF